MSASLIIAYRRRPEHLAHLLKWAAQQGYFDNRNFEFILVEQDSKPTASETCRLHGIEYVHIDEVGAFHKTKLLNIGTQFASSQFIVPFDVDLVPIRNSLHRHLEMAKKYESALITGFRVLHKNHYEFPETIDESFLVSCTIAPEDQPSALFKQLVAAEKFGVLPFFQREQLISIGAWDELFIGWGAEDQDLIERYTKHFDVLRSSDLVYLHLDHGADNQWKDGNLIKANREYYYKKRAKDELQDS